MAATINDKITKTSNGSRPLATTVSTSRNSGNTTLACASLVGWPTTTAVHFVTYKAEVGSDGKLKVVPGSQSDWKGIASGNDIINLTLTGGTDNGNAVGDYVEMLPTAQWGTDLAEGLLVSLDQDGTLKPNTVGAAQISDEAVTEDKYADDSIPTAAYKDGSVTPDKLLAGSPSNWDWIDFASSVTTTGWSSFTQKDYRYCVVGNICFIIIKIEGPSNSTTSTISLPKAAALNTTTPASILNNSSWGVGHVMLNVSTATLYTGALASLAATGAKGIRVNLFYPIGT